jgi:branched-chain amino acid transport system ATP-binding protein
MSMLEIKNISVAYGHIQALTDVSFQVPWGQIISIIGSNGAGKTTLLNAISGVVKKQAGEITLDGAPLEESPHKVVKKGVVHVPEGRRIFAGLTVAENLTIGGYLGKASESAKKAEEMYDLFPILSQRRKQLAGTLSGGEQQMLAISRGLMANPKLILLDEPSLGLAPLVIKVVFDIIQKIKTMGITVLLVEQNASKALSICDYAYVLENGRIVLSGEPQKLLGSPEIKKAYLGEKEEVTA